MPLLIRTSAAAATAAAAGVNGGEKATEWNTTTDFAAAAAAEMVESLAVVSIDLAPTVLDMAGIDVPEDMDGVSLLKIIGNSKVNNKVNIASPLPKTILWQQQIETVIL